MGGIAHAEDAAIRHCGGVHIVDGPGRDRLDGHLEIGIADQIAHHFLRMRFVHFRRRLVDVVTPDDQPLVPGPDHPHQTHADAADVSTRLQHPVKHRGTMSDQSRQIGLEQDVHRAGNAHLAFEGKARMFRNLGIAAIGADQIFRADGELLAGQPVETGRRDPVFVLHMAQIFRRHARLAAARTGRLEQQRLHEGLRQVVHMGRRRQLVLGARQGMFAPALHPADLFAGERGAEDVLAHQILLGRKHIGLILNVASEIAQYFHGALVGDVGARRTGEPAVPVDHQVLDPVGRQQGRGGRARRAGADDEYVGGNVSHEALPYA